MQGGVNSLACASLASDPFCVRWAHDHRAFIEETMSWDELGSENTERDWVALARESKHEAVRLAVEALLLAARSGPTSFEGLRDRQKMTSITQSPDPLAAEATAGS